MTKDWETIGFRVVKTSRVRDVSGYGASIKGARWNHVKVPALYVAESRSLAALEALVHNIMQVGTGAFSLVEIRLPAGLDRAAYPETHCPSLEASKSFGTLWLRSQAQPLLRVPSFVMPGEWNWLINPQHHLVSQHIQTGLLVHPFAFDARFWAGGSQ